MRKTIYAWKGTARECQMLTRFKKQDRMKAGMIELMKLSIGAIIIIGIIGLIGGLEMRFQ